MKGYFEGLLAGQAATCCYLASQLPSSPPRFLSLSSGYKAGTYFG